MLDLRHACRLDCLMEAIDCYIYPPLYVAAKIAGAGCKPLLSSGLSCVRHRRQPLYQKRMNQ